MRLTTAEARRLNEMVRLNETLKERNALLEDCIKKMINKAYLDDHKIGTPGCDWFTEGFDTLDLKEAKACFVSWPLGSARTPEESYTQRITSATRRSFGVTSTMALSPSLMKNICERTCDTFTPTSGGRA